MRWTQTLIPTLRQVPAEAVVPSHQLMLRAGLIQQVSAGSYTYLPLGWRALTKVMAIVREEMERAGAVEVFLPTLQPIEWWEQTGRRADYGQNLFVVTDRHGREQALGPTHEEVMTKLVATCVHSYRQLPLTLYQIQTKFRDEFRPRFGVLRSREFQMKDAYSFDLTVEGLDISYQKMYDAYCRIFDRCGLDYVVVEAESGPIGGSASHEFMVTSPTGEDVILSSDRGNYAANVEKCETGARSHDFGGPPTGDLEMVHTPNLPSIDDVGKFMRVKPVHLLKSMLYVATPQPQTPKAEPWYVIAVVRGDHEINESKLARAAAPFLGGAVRLEMAPESPAMADGFALGYVGPHAFVGRDDALLVVDPDAAQGQFWAAGANGVDHHVKHFNWGREVPGVADHPRVGVADIRNAVAGDPSPREDGGVLVESRGIEVGHVFKLGCKYSKALGLKVSDENQQEREVIMGCYGIGVNRILAAAVEAEAGHDTAGLIWPVAIAPYHVVLTPIRYEGRMKEEADRLYQQLEQQGLEVLLDDRAERPGVKFKDADLVGIPLRITIGDKVLADEQVELKFRSAAEAERLGLGEVVDRVVSAVRGG